MASLALFLSYLVLAFLGSMADQASASDKTALLEFAAATFHVRDLNWDPTSSHCSGWTGVSCSSVGERVVALRLPAVGLRGQIPANTLGRLSALRILSLRFNALTGQLPSDFANLSALTALHLENKHLSGHIPAFLSKLTRLRILNLAGNNLTGEIPDVPLPHLKLLNLSNNCLTGSIPQSFIGFPYSSFADNDIFPPPSLLTSSPIPPPKKLKGRTLLLAIIASAVSLVLVVLAGSIFLCFWPGAYSSDFLDVESREVVVASERLAENAELGEMTGMGELVHDNEETSSQEGRRCLPEFDVEPLLSDWAVVLGRGILGAAFFRALVRIGRCFSGV